MKPKDIINIAIQFVEQIMLNPSLTTNELENMEEDELGDLNLALQIVQCDNNGFLIKNQGEIILGVLNLCGNIICYVNLDSWKYCGPCELYDDSPQIVQELLEQTMASLRTDSAF